jgi:hypothetical protein
MHEVFTYVIQHPDHVEAFSHSNLVIRMNMRDPDAEILLDGRQPPLQVFYGPRPGAPTWRSPSTPTCCTRCGWEPRAPTRRSYSGRISTRGNLLKAMQLTEVFTAAERIYPTIASSTVCWRRRSMRELNPEMRPGL